MEIGYAALDGDKVIGWSLEMHDDYIHEFDNLDWLNGQWSGMLDDLRYENGKVYDSGEQGRKDAEQAEADRDAVLDTLPDAIADLSESVSDNATDLAVVMNALAELSAIVSDLVDGA